MGLWLWLAVFTVVSLFLLVCTSGQSSVNFIFNIVEAYEGAHGDFSLKEGRPFSGQTTFIIFLIY